MAIQQLIAKIAAIEKKVASVNDEVSSSVYIIPKPDTGELRRQEERLRWIKTAKLMYQSFSADELAELCLEMGTFIEDVRGDTRKAKIVNLVFAYGRQNLFDYLLDHLREARPFVDWP